jgi:hypothetical protein
MAFSDAEGSIKWKTWATVTAKLSIDAAGFGILLL